MNLPISIGILSWNSSETLRNTLESYKKNGLLDIANDITLFFQEMSYNDVKIANEYGINYYPSHKNIGIGNAFIKLVELAKTENILLLEHDWELIEDKNTTFERLKAGIELLNSGYNVIRLRHRTHPGYPLYSQQAYQGKELNNYQEIIDLDSPHLMDCIHWVDYPEIKFSDKISKYKDHFISTSRWSIFTNNPCLYKKDFYFKKVYPFKEIKEKNPEYYKNFNNNLDYYGSVEPWKHSLEVDISYWWARQNFKVAWGEGLFTHNDIQKYGMSQYPPQNKQNSISFIFAHRPTDKWSIPLSIVNEFQRLGWKTTIYSLFNENNNYTNYNIFDLLKTTPDIIMHMDWGQHNSPILKELKKTGAYCIMESGDDPQKFEDNSIKAPWFDLILSPDIESVEQYNKMGHNAKWWTHFSDTNIHFSLNEEPKYMAVCSRGMGNGAFIIDNLTQKYPNQIINQNGWEEKEHNQFLNSGKIVLQQSRYGEITRRIFEGMSCKKLVITDRLNNSTKINELFEENKDIIYYNNETDCLEKILYYNNNPEEAEKIAINGYNKVIQNHTQIQRVKFIIDNWKNFKKNK